jgi:hypothetical protein
MKKRSLRRYLPALALAALLACGAGTLAQNSRRSAPQPRVPQNRFRSEPDRYVGTSSDRDARNLIEDLENSTPEEVRTGRIGRFFTDPAVIITNGQMHRIDWNRIRDEGNDRYRRDQEDRNYDSRDRSDPTDRGGTGARIENFQTRRIDARTVVVLYTAVLPGSDGDFRQPVVATLIRESSGRGWRVASYTAENAAIPGGGTVEEDLNSLRSR